MSRPSYTYCRKVFDELEEIGWVLYPVHGDKYFVGYQPLHENPKKNVPCFVFPVCPRWSDNDEIYRHTIKVHALTTNNCFVAYFDWSDRRNRKKRLFICKTIDYIELG